MTTYIAEDGTLITDDMVDRWAAEAEAGFPDCEVTEFVGHPEEVHARMAMTPRTIRASAVLWDLIDAEATRAGLSASAWTRQALADAIARAHG